MNKIETFFANIKTHVESLWASISAEEKKVYPILAKIIGIATTVAGNSILDKLAELVSGGKITATDIATFNSILPTVTKDLGIVDTTAGMTPEAAFAFWIGKLQALTPAQQQSIEAAIATEWVKLLGGNVTTVEAEINGILTLVNSGVL